MSDIKLGQIIEGNPGRDAIHIAIAPVIAAHALSPGAHVGLLLDGTAGQSPTPIGIVDPFLNDKVKQGEKFWLCLYQQTVTGMRHHWHHPVFSGDAAAPSIEIVKSKITEIAMRFNMTYDEMMAAAKGWVERNEEVDDDFRNWDVPDEFWVYYEIITGQKGSGSFFSCCI